MERDHGERMVMVDTDADFRASARWHAYRANRCRTGAVELESILIVISLFRSLCNGYRQMSDKF